MKENCVLYISYDSVLDPIPQSQVIPYLKLLAHNGFKFHWLTFEKNSSATLLLKRQLRNCSVNLHSLPYYKRPYLAAKVINIFFGIFFACFYAFWHRARIVHCRSEVASIIGAAVKSFCGTKLIYDRRGFMAEDYVEGGMWKSRKSFLYKLLILVDSFLLRYSDHIVVLTLKMKIWLLQHRPYVKNKISVIPCCVDLEKFNVLAQVSLKENLGLTGNFVIVYSGSLGTWYMLEEMLDFFLVAKGIIDNAHFLILTSYDKVTIEKQARFKNVSQNDITIRSVPFDKMPFYLSIADAALCFIKPVLSKVASSPTKFAEFLASGKPVIINSGIGDTDDMLKKENVGVVVNNFDRVSYEDSIVRLTALLKNADGLRERCISSAKKHFLLSDGAMKYYNIYDNLLSLQEET